MSLVGELSCFLGLQVKQLSDGVFISQQKYDKSLVTKFGLEKGKSARTPISTTCKLSKTDEGKNVDPSLYRSMIGSLPYLTTSRQDICYSVSVCARYQLNPKESHLIAVKCIVNDTTDYGIWYSRDSIVNLAGFSDVDDRKKHIKRVLLHWQQLGVMVQQETTIHLLVNGRGRVYHRR